MRKLDLREIHEYGLGCLAYFDDVCKKYGLCYSLAYGSLIGAIRHKGFIPWDDDIDVMMPRKDYEKLVRIFVEEKEISKRYRFINERTDLDYYYTVGRICDKTTKIFFTNNSKNVMNMGVFIDIYPLDDMPNSNFTIKVFSPIYKFIVVALWISNSRKYSKANNFIISIIKYFIFIFTKITGFHFLFCLQRILLNLCKGSSAFYDAWDNFGYVIPKKYFDDIIEVDFENLKVKAIREYDSFLRRQYGNYMQLPSVDKQIPHHEYEAFLLEDNK